MTKNPRKSVKRKAPKPAKRAKKPAQKPARKSVKPTKTARKASKTQKPSPKFRSPHGRAESNPFREGSAYGVVYDVLAHAGSTGISRQQLVTDVARITKKDQRHASFDCQVLLSARENGERHQSCRSGFWVERTNDHLVLHVTAQPTAGK